MTRKKHDIIVVGAGLFGSIAATLARAEGHTVTVIGTHRQYEASPASGCVLAPSWLSSMEKPAIADALAVLGELYTLHDLEFKTNLLKTFKAQRVSLAEVLVKPDIDVRVTTVGDGAVEVEGTQKLKGTVLVAAGIWCQELLPSMPVVRGLYGCSLKVPGQLEQPRIHAYAPYRQAVGFNLDRKHVWFGDGTALIENTWKAQEPGRISFTRERAMKMMGNTGLGVVSKVKPTVGARPYVEGHKAGYFERVHANTWVSTGGAKNGTVLAAAQALAFVRSLK